MTLPPIFWINLERNPRRRAQMSAHLSERGLQHQRIVAVDGAGTSHGPVIATIASHLRALQALCASDADEAIVMEDDTSFELFDVWPDGFARLRRALPRSFGALQLCVGEEPDRLHALYRARGDVVRYAPPGYWSTGAYLVTRSAAAHVIAACAPNGQLEVETLPEPRVADSVLFRLIASMPGVDGPWIARIPLFLFGAEDSDVHPDHLGHQRRARRFVRAAHPALLAGEYGRFSLWWHRLRGLSLPRTMT